MMHTRPRWVRLRFATDDPAGGSEPTPTDVAEQLKPDAPAPPGDDPDKAELEQLRKERADRDKTEREAAAAELEELRAYRKQREDEDARRVPAPKPKAEKTPPADPAPKGDEKTKRPRSRVSRSWFGSAADADD